MNIKIVQCTAAKCDCETNYKRIEEATSEAVSSGHTDVLVFPETVSKRNHYWQDFLLSTV